MQGRCKNDAQGYAASPARQAPHRAGMGLADHGYGADGRRVHLYRRSTDRMNPTTSSASGGARITGGGIGEGPGPRLMTAGTLSGDKVVNRQDETLGKIDDVMLDVEQGRIAYAVMSAGGLLGVGEKLFALPWSALTLDTDRKCFVLDAEKSSFKNAPGFDKDRWPDSADPQWHQRVHEYYHSEPYWM
jgi:sporulation protein YlmC with PRC-barrel domain